MYMRRFGSFNHSACKTVIFSNCHKYCYLMWLYHILSHSHWKCYLQCRTPQTLHTMRLSSVWPINSQYHSL